MTQDIERKARSKINHEPIVIVNFLYMTNTGETKEGTKSFFNRVRALYFIRSAKKNRKLFIIGWTTPDEDINQFLWANS